MKKLFNYCVLLSALFLYSCTNADDFEGMEENVTEQEKSVIDLTEKSFSGLDGEIIELPNGLFVKKIDDNYIFEGDILISEDHIEAFGNEATTKSTLQTRKRWPDATVYYTFNIGLSSTLVARIESAIMHWEDKTNIRFVRRTNQNSYLEFIYDSNGPYASDIGYNGGRQVIGVSNGSGVGNLIHEIGHIVGLWHEHTRPDRDDYITINWDNILIGMRPQFYKDSLNNNAHGAFDFGSIMMYGPTAFHKPNTLITIARNDGLSYSIQRDSLSNGDKAGVHSMYPYLLWPRTQTINVTTAGTHSVRFWSRKEASTWQSIQVTSKPDWVTNTSITQDQNSSGNALLNFTIPHVGFRRQGVIKATQASSGYQYILNLNLPEVSGSREVHIYGTNNTAARVEVFIDGRQQPLPTYWSFSGSSPLICAIPHQQSYPYPEYTADSEIIIMLEFFTQITHFSLITSKFQIIEGGTGNKTVKIKGKLGDLPASTSSIGYLSIQ